MSTVLGNGIRYERDVCYGTDYPNSYLDIYSAPSENERLPVLAYIHGGGFGGGDKADGDPNAPAQSSVVNYLQEICLAGYHVVSLNYALTPDYQYPVPMVQINQAVEYLVDHAEEYGLDMDQVFLSGSSAGGQLAGQYANLVTNQAYAQEMGIKTPISKENMAGVVLNCALLEPVNFDTVGDASIDFMYRALKRVYFQDSGMLMQQGDVTGNLCQDFPPAYITDGNTVTFDDQAARLDERLSELGIPHVFNGCSNSDEEIPHGYESDLSNPIAQDNLEKTLAFMKDACDRVF